MKYLIVLFVIAAVSASKMAVTREEIERLKRTVDWEVTEYEDNIFKGWTVDEVESLMITNIPEDDDSIPSISPLSNLPTKINWAGSKCDHRVVNQASCGASHSVAVAGMLSDRCCIAGHDHGWLSIQELINCERQSKGCNGGWPTWNLDYVVKSNGLVEESCLPFVGKNAPCIKACKDGKEWESSHVCNCIGGYKKCSGDAGIKSCLQSGPSTLAFGYCGIIHYKKGIYKCDCDGNYQGVHIVMAMGYSEMPSCYYIAKNSWGSEWGDKGYFKIDCNTCEIGKKFNNGNTVCTNVSS